MKLTFLITSGPTREYIDPVRYITNASTGIMGACLADEAVKLGHKVVFIAGVSEFMPKRKCEVINVVSADNMFEAVKEKLPKANIVIGAAAVADYKPLRTAENKIKKTSQQLNLKLTKTPDIIAYAGRKKKNQIVVSFALETNKYLENAKLKLKSKNADFVVLNTHKAISAKNTDVKLISIDNILSVKGSKSAVAREIINESIRLYKNIKAGSNNT